MKKLRKVFALLTLVIAFSLLIPTIINAEDITDISAVIQIPVEGEKASPRGYPGNNKKYGVFSVQYFDENKEEISPYGDEVFKAGKTYTIEIVFSVINKGVDTITATSATINDRYTAAFKGNASYPEGSKRYSFNYTVPSKVSQYQITYVKNGGNGIMDNTSASDGEVYTLPKCNYTAPTGSVFSKWSVKVGSASSVDKQPGDKVTITADTTITAIWESTTRTVTFNLNGGSMSGANPINVNYGDKVSRPSDPSKTGYIFDDWYTDATYSKKFNFNSTPIRNNTTIYAKFIKQYKITINVNGGNNKGLNTSIDTYEGEVLERSYFEKMVKDTANLIPPTGVSFDYIEINGTRWNTKNYTVSGNVTLKIMWDTAYHKVYFKDKNKTLDTLDIAHGGYVTKPDDPNKPGYTFYAWYKDVDYSSFFSFTSTPITEDTNIYAKFDRNWKVYYDANGGTKGVDWENEGTVSEGFFYTYVGNVFLPNSNIIKAPEGKKYLGVEITDSNGSTIYYRGTDSRKYTVESDFTIKYLWGDITTTYSVVFKDGDSTIETVSVIDGNKVARPTNPEKESYRFDGWYTDTTYTTKFDFDNKTIKTDTTIYAKFIRQYAITLSANGGTNEGWIIPPADEGTVINRADFESNFNNHTYVTPPTGKTLDYLEIDGVR